MPELDQPTSAWQRNLARRKAVGIDWVLLTVVWLMAEFLLLAFSGRRGPTGMLLTAEQILDLLHYGTAAVGGLALALLWNAAYRLLGASPGRALVVGAPEWEQDLAWTRTLRGWFTAVFIELTLFTGWLITELELVTFFTKFGKAADIVRGLMLPSGSVLHEGFILLVQTVFLAFMATAFAIPVAFVLAFPSARNLTRGSPRARLAYAMSRTVMNFVRAVEPLVWALIFISWVGIGPFAGVLALWVHSVAALTKLYSEQIESVDQGPIDAITAICSRVSITSARDNCGSAGFSTDR